jgi:gamma-glutamyltranspeptidase/glutathione hydrolase
LNWNFPYRHPRMPLLARNVVATSQPLAAQAGLRMLLKGGNAVDAAIATAVTLNVVEPTMNGIGSDAFALVWDGKQLRGLNASGRSPAAWTPQRFAGLSSMPQTGWDSVTVPGAVSAWAALWREFGRLPFEELFIPAIEYADKGFLVSHTVSRQWHAQRPRLEDQPGFAAHFLPEGRTPQAGQLFRSAEQARTLTAIAASHGESFYRGELAAKMVAFSKKHGGALTLEDLASHAPEWVQPLGLPYGDCVVHEIPPNGQGIGALIGLGILSQTDLAHQALDSASSVHLQIEAMKLAFADVYRNVAEPSMMTAAWPRMLESDYLAERARSIRPDRAQTFGPGFPSSSETVYLTTADASGMMVSFIQSNYMGFGSGVVVPGTGISLQNRGAGFSLKAGHPNQVAGGKRPFHTIIPGFITRDGEALASFGVMGGDMQPQGHLQMVVRLARYGQNPQAAADAPRWRITPDGTVLFESEWDARVVDALSQRGHPTRIAETGSLDFGAAQMIQKIQDGYLAASESRRDGQAVGF